MTAQCACGKRTDIRILETDGSEEFWCRSCFKAHVDYFGDFDALDTVAEYSAKFAPDPDGYGDWLMHKRQDDEVTR